LVIGRHTQSLNINVENEPIKQTNQFIYLETVCSYDGKIDKEIDIRCNKTNKILRQLAFLLQHRTIPMTTKKHLIQSIGPIHSHLVLLVSNIVAAEEAEKQAGNNRDAMFKKSSFSDQKRPN
jgi:hypothetical protein